MPYGCKLSNQATKSYSVSAEFFLHGANITGSTDEVLELVPIASVHREHLHAKP